MILALYLHFSNIISHNHSFLHNPLPQNGHSGQNMWEVCHIFINYNSFIVVQLLKQMLQTRFLHGTWIILNMQDYFYKSNNGAISW